MVNDSSNPATFNAIFQCLFNLNCQHSASWSSLLTFVIWPTVFWIVLTKWVWRSRKKSQSTSAVNASEPIAEQTANSQLASLTAHMTSSMLPPFWPDNPEAWFINVESQFNMTGITNEIAKFQKVICKLPPEITNKVMHITSKPFQVGDYHKLKEAILGIFKKSRTRRWQEILSLSNIQNMKPTAILNQIRNLTLSTNPSDVINLQEEDLKLHFLRALPSHMQALFSVISKTCSLDELATQADTYLEHSPTNANIAAVELQTQPVQSHNPEITSDGMWDKVVTSLDAIASKVGYKRQSNQDHFNRTAQLCFFHRRFGDSARKCAGHPCPKN